MLIQIVSYKSALSTSERIRLTASIINSSVADLILFSGHTLNQSCDIKRLNQKISNKKSIAVIEVWQNHISEINPVENSLFLLIDGVVKNLYTHQLFTDSKNINEYPELGEYLLSELETRRKFSVCDKNIIVIQCGENNILRNIQSDGNKATFRFYNNIELNKRFTSILDNTDIILNPQHSPMGNQGKMRKRREFFSANNRAYFSTANFTGDKDILNKSLQYACINGIEQEHVKIELGIKNSYISRYYLV